MIEEENDGGPIMDLGLAIAVGTKAHWSRLRQMDLYFASQEGSENMWFFSPKEIHIIEWVLGIRRHEGWFLLPVQTI